MYHEYTHASHAFFAGPFYWSSVVRSEAANGLASGDPYANPGVPYITDLGRVAMAESWGEHIEHVFADKKYGAAASGTMTYLAIIEGLILNNGYIPEGLYWDLIDNTPLEARVADAVSGYTNAQMFSNIDAEDPAIFKGRLGVAFPPVAPNTVAGYNALFASYGY